MSRYDEFLDAVEDLQSDYPGLSNAAAYEAIHKAHPGLWVAAASESRHGVISEREQLAVIQKGIQTRTQQVTRRLLTDAVEIRKAMDSDPQLYRKWVGEAWGKGW